MKKRITLIITASILVLALGSFIGVQAYQYYAPHGYIVSDKMVHKPDCSAINQTEKKILTETDCFQDVYINNKYGNCPICNPPAPSLSSVQNLYKQWKISYETLSVKSEENKKIENNVYQAMNKSHSMQLTYKEYYSNSPYHRFGKNNYIAEYILSSKPHDEADDYMKEDMYLLDLLKEKGYSYSTPMEAQAACNQSTAELKEEVYTCTLIQATENYLKQRKNVFYFFNK